MWPLQSTADPAQIVAMCSVSSLQSYGAVINLDAYDHLSTLELGTGEQ